MQETERALRPEWRATDESVRRWLIADRGGWGEEGEIGRWGHSTYLLDRRDVQEQELPDQPDVVNFISSSRAKCTSLTRKWYVRSASTGQMTMMEMRKATALPIPCDVPTACRKFRSYFRVSRYKWMAVVHITKIRVITCKWSGREMSYIDSTPNRGPDVAIRA